MPPLVFPPTLAIIGDFFQFLVNPGFSNVGFTWLYPLIISCAGMREAHTRPFRRQRSRKHLSPV